MKRFVLILATLFATAGAASAASDGVSCMRDGDQDGQLDRLPDCMRMGRHVRVGASVSRGTAALGDGYISTGLADGQGEGGRDIDRRVSVPPNPLTILPSLIFGR